MESEQIFHKTPKKKFQNISPKTNIRKEILTESSKQAQDCMCITPLNKNLHTAKQNKN